MNQELQQPKIQIKFPHKTVHHKMQQQLQSPLYLLPPIPSLNLQPPPLTCHSYTLKYQKRHFMLINGDQQFDSQSEELSAKCQPRSQDFTQVYETDLKQPQATCHKQINITLLNRCPRCLNWLPFSDITEHMTFHAAIILQNLFLGDKFSSQSKKQLIQRLQVTHVVNAASQLPNMFHSDGVKYFNLDLFDTMEESVVVPCLEAAEFIETVFSQGGKVFVHCAMGKSRSVAVILTYLMKYKGMSLSDSLTLVKDKRSIIKPNPSYLKQLETLEQNLNSAKTNT